MERRALEMDPNRRGLNTAKEHLGQRTMLLGFWLIWVPEIAKDFWDSAGGIGIYSGIGLNGLVNEKWMEKAGVDEHMLQKKHSASHDWGQVRTPSQTTSWMG